MAEINKNDIFSDDALRAPLEMKKNIDEVIRSIDKLLNVSNQSGANIAVAKSVNKINEETTKLTNTQKQLEVLNREVASNSKRRTAEEIASLEKLVQKREFLKKNIQSLIKDQKEDLELMRRSVITRDEYNKRINQSNVIIAKNRQQILGLNKSTKDEILLTRTVGNEYKKLTISLEQARAKYKNLAASGKASNAQLREQQRVVQNLNQKVTTIDGAVGQFSRNVGNYSSTFKTAASSLRGFIGAFGLVTGVALFARVLKGVVDLMVDFEYQNSRIKATLGATARETKELKDQQLELGRTTQFTANQIATLQLELGKLGFPIADVKEMTASTLDAALAMGSELSEQAALTGATLRSYGLTAKDTQRVNDALAKAVSSSALDFRKLETSLPFVSAAANALGISLEGTLSLMGRLSNAGFQASTIGTTLRNVFLKLSDTTGALSKRLEEPVKDIPTLIKGLRQLKEEGIDLGEAFELTDQRSVAAFITLVNGVDEIEALNKALLNAKGTARDMAREMGDNLRGDVLLLTSAWQGLILSLTEGDSWFARTIRSVVKLTTSFLSLITPIDTLTDKVKKEQAALNALVRQIELNNDNNEERNRLLDELDKEYPTFLKNLDKETVTSGQLAERLKDVNEQFEKRIRLAVVEDKLVGIEEKRFELREKLRKSTQLQAELEQRLKTARDDDSGATGLSERSRIQQSISAQIGLQQNAQKELNELGEEFSKISDAHLGQQKEFNEGGNNFFETISKIKTKEESRLEDAVKAAGSIKERMASEIALEQFRKKQSLGALQQELSNRFAVAKGNEQLLFITKDIESKREAVIAQSEENIKQIRLRTEKELSKLSIEQFNSQFKLNEFRLEQEIKYATTIEERVNKEKDLELLRKKFLLNNAELTETERQLIIEKSIAEIKAIEIKGDEDIASERIRMAKELNSRITEETKAEIDRRTNEVRLALSQGIIDQREADKQIAQITRDFTDQAINAQIDNIKKILDFDNLSKEEQADLEKELFKLRTDLQNEYYDELNENRKKDLEREAEHFENILDIYSNFAGSANSIFGSITDRKIQDINSELNARKDALDRELILAGDNEAAKDQLRLNAAQKEQELERQRIEAQRKAAIFEKATQLIAATIQAKINYLKALGTPPVPNIPLATLSAVLSGLQIAAIAATPIPQYAEGTKAGGHSGGFAVVGEEGSELGTTPSGKMFLTPSRATLMNLPRGTDIKPHGDTMRTLAMAGLESQYETMIRRDKPIVLDNSDVVNAIKSQRMPDYARIGSDIYEVKKYKDGSKQYIRSKSMSR